jgi:hypothetical protein
MLLPRLQAGMDSPAVFAPPMSFLSFIQGETGLMLGCCGRTALWAGDEIRLNDNYTVIIAHGSCLQADAGFSLCHLREMFERYLRIYRGCPLRAYGQGRAPSCRRR